MGKNENIKIYNCMKKIKFVLEKYKWNLFKTINIISKAVENNFERKNLNISEKWLVQKGKF